MTVSLITLMDILRFRRVQRPIKANKTRIWNTFVAKSLFIVISRQ